MLLLFGLMIADRVFYALGSQAGKAALHFGAVALYFPTFLRLFWLAPPAAEAARSCVRVFLALKCGSAGLSALQLRSGFPPRASPTGTFAMHCGVFYLVSNVCV